MRNVLILGIFLALTACGGAADLDDATSGGDPQTAVGPDPAPLADLSNGECPDLSTPGIKTFTSAGTSRSITVLFPEDRPSDMPVVFVWHPLGASADMMVQALKLQSMADTHRAVVVVPSLPPSVQIWGFAGDPTDDLSLYDDMRTCLSESLDVDLWRVTTTGMSAGALWSTYLLMQRGDSLAAGFLMSGGLAELPGYFKLPYTSPAEQMPILLTWGGPHDTWGYGSNLIYFENASGAFKDELLKDGHFVVTCDHGGGHNLPPEAQTMSEAWLLNHSFGQPSPFKEELAGLPDYCELAN